MLLWLLGAIAASYVAAANEATQDEVRSWIQSEWERAASLPDLKGFEFRFRIEHREVLPEQKLAELRALVAGRPDHPERKTIERSERRKSRGPDVLDHRLWLLSSGEWRLNTDQPNGLWFDSVRSPRGDWGLSQHQLTLLDSGVRPPDGFDLEVDESVLRWQLGFLFYGGFSLSGSIGLKPADVIIENSSWRLTAHGPNSSIVQFSGIWDPRASRGFVSEVRLLKIPGSDEEGKWWSCKGWRFDDKLNQWMAQSAEEFDRAGRPLSAILVRGVEARSEPEIRALLEAPAYDGADPVRGPLTVRAVQNYRTDREVQHAVTPSGLQEVLAVDRMSQQRSDQWLRVLGWSLLAACVCLFLILRLRRARAGLA